MELIKKNIYMNKLKGKTVTQITLDDDFNVPDSKMDMEQIILDRGELQLDESRPMNDKVSLSGKLKFDVLYSTPASGSLESMSGEIPFDELVNMEEREERDRLQTQWEMEDLTVEMIHSRKDVYKRQNKRRSASRCPQNTDSSPFPPQIHSWSGWRHS